MCWVMQSQTQQGRRFVTLPGPDTAFVFTPITGSRDMPASISGCHQVHVADQSFRDNHRRHQDGRAHPRSPRDVDSATSCSLIDVRSENPAAWPAPAAAPGVHNGIVCGDQRLVVPGGGRL
jgi:hypothetical protein